MSPLLSVESLECFYGPAQALHDLSMHLNPGESVCVLGPNGAGKSTLLRTVAGLHREYSGQLRFNDQTITGMRSWEVARLGIALVPQGRRCFASLSVEENLYMGAYHLSAGERSATVDRVYASFPVLYEKKCDKAKNLSGGQQQMLAIGRALMMRPQVMLLDEPSLGLSPLLVQQVGQLLSDLAADYNTAMLIVEQNVHLAFRVASRGYILRNGVQVLEGPRAFMEDHLKEAYFGSQQAEG